MAKFDSLRSLVREKYEPGHTGNFGDSCGETCRAMILGDKRGDFMSFITATGYVRHRYSLWREDDFSNDMLLPLLMAAEFENVETKSNRWKIRGTNTFVSIGVWGLVRKQYWLLNVANIVQGWLFNLKFRINDNGTIERLDGKVQDWLNYICIYVFLKKKNKWATLNQDKKRCIKAVRKYYLEGPDWEPNSQWIVELYEKNL